MERKKGDSLEMEENEKRSLSKVECRQANDESRRSDFLAKVDKPLKRS